MAEGALPYCKVDRDAVDDKIAQSEDGFADEASEETSNGGPAVENDNDESSGVERTLRLEVDDGRTTSTSCYRRLKYEISAPFFHTREPSGLYIDIQRTFCPEPAWLVLLARVCFFLVSLEVLLQTLVLETDPDKRWFFMAYLTHWGLVVALAYQLAALLCALLRRSMLHQPTDAQGVGVDACSMLVRITWALFALAAPAETIVVMLYWGLDYSPGGVISYDDVMRHGGVCALLIVDGLLISSIPLRIKQVFLLMSFCVSYLTWTVIFAHSDIEDPNEDDDDAIYDVLAWNADPEGSLILSALCGFVLPPVIFFLFWALALLKRRVYQESNHRTTSTLGHTLEMEMSTFIQEDEIVS